MSPKFEIKYIEIQWYDEQTVTKVIESEYSLRITFNEESQDYECETTIYPNADGFLGQLAIRVLDDNATPPHINMPSGEVKYLEEIKDKDTGRLWWIEKDTWDEKNTYWRHSGVNTAGMLNLSIAGQRCHVNIGSMDFSFEQLDNYLDSFKNDLWELILDESSSIQTNKMDSAFGINKDAIDCIKQLVGHAQKILESPKGELREVQELRPRKAVRPVNRTFMELVSKPNQRFLTSRATTPTYNVPENRYVLFALQRCYRIIKQIRTLSENKSKRYLNTVSKLQGQLSAFQPTVTFNRDLVVADLERLKVRCNIEYWQAKLAERLALNNINLYKRTNLHSVIRIKTEQASVNNVSNEKDGFFIQVFINGNWLRINGNTTILSFRHSAYDLINCLEPYSEYELVGEFKCKQSTRANFYNIIELAEVKLISTRGFESARSNYRKEFLLGKTLNENSWQRALTSKEVEEQEKEKAAIKNRIDFYSKNQELAAFVWEKVAPKERLLQTLIKELKSLNIKESSHFPNSMTFVQNPNYQGVHNGYRKLRELTHLTDEDILVSLEKVDAMGLVNMPLLYERWCLLQIIIVLKEAFRFRLQKDWKHRIIEAVGAKKKDIRIALANNETKRFITLAYEKTLTNRRIPDYIIDLIWFADSDTNNEYPQQKRFVMDAKFYDNSTFQRFDGLSGVIHKLSKTKDYSEQDENPVFIIHPCKDAISHRVTAQDWGETSYLGEIPYADERLQGNHDSGGIYLSPIDSKMYTDELQRLLGLFLQYKLEEMNTKSSDRSDDRTSAVPFCIRCGSSDLHIKSKSNNTRFGKPISRTNRSVWMQCNDCNHFMSFNHCNHTNTRLIKNGTYWTYHSARAIEPFNIKCPKCGEWGAW